MQTLERPVEAAAVAKQPSTRLMDMLAGWSEYAQRDGYPNSDAAAVIDAICDLYQEAGGFAFDKVSLEDDEARVRAFLMENVLPVLLHR